MTPIYATTPLETSKSIIKDVLLREIPVAVKKDEVLAEEVCKLKKAEQRARNDIAAAQKKISRAQVLLREFVVEHFADLILRLDGSSIETISDFFEREIGDSGIVLDTKIQNAFSKHLDAVSSDLVRIQTSLNSDISAFDAHMGALGRNGLDWIAKSNVINASSIKASRDLLWSSFKFKPWGAVKLAKGLNGALAVVGIAFEIWDSWKETERKQEFDKSKKALRANLEEQRKQLLDKVNKSDFSTYFFPGFTELEDKLNMLSAELKKTEEQRKVFAQWRICAEAIDAEFNKMDSSD